MTSVDMEDTISYHNPGNPDSDDMSIGYTIGCSLGPAPKPERKVMENRKDNMRIPEWGDTIREVVEP